MKGEACLRLGGRLGLGTVGGRGMSGAQRFPPRSECSDMKTPQLFFPLPALPPHTLELKLC